MIIKAKKLIEMARRWRRVAALGRRRISLTNPTACPKSDPNCCLSIAEKGRFVVYTIDSKRLMVPLAYLRSSIFVELFRMSEEGFGLPTDGPITLPFDAVFVEYILSLLRGRVTKDVEKTLINSISIHRCATTYFSRGLYSQQVVCGF